MSLLKKIQPIRQAIAHNFSKQHKKLRDNIALATCALLHCNKVNTAEIARHMTPINGLNFKANDMKVYRMLSAKSFQVDDKMWRGYINLFFQTLPDKCKPKNNQYTINVDYTTDNDDFLILHAAVVIDGQSLPIYFSMRRYPKRKGMHDQKKLETAFFKALKHVLPNDNQYMIVADRGFGNIRIMDLLESLGFTYVLRLTENLNIQRNEKTVNVNELPHRNYTYEKTYVVRWDRDVRLVKRVLAEKSWLLLTNLTKFDLSSKSVLKIYQERFSIEKMFKNQKSGGLGMESWNIKKYERFKRLLFLSCMAYFLLLLSGLLLQKKSIISTAYS